MIYIAFLIDKDMKKIFLLTLLIIFNFAISKSQVCTPDISMTGTGISPTVLPNGIIGEAYSVTVSLKVPKDSIIRMNNSDIPVTVDSAKVIYINNLPDTSFKYECNRPNCTWIGGSFGCAKLSGMPKSTHFKSYAIKVYVNSWLSSPSFPGTQFERIDSSTIDFSIPGGVNGIDNINTKLYFNAYPNPAKDKIYIFGAEINPKTCYEISLMDISGKVVKSLTPKAFGDVFEIPIDDINKGVYLLKVSDTEKSSYQKMIIE